MTTLLTNAFGTGAIDDHFDDGGGSFASYSGGALVFSGEGCVVSKTSLGTGNKWARMRFLALPGTASPFYGVGFGNASGDAHIALLTNNAGAAGLEVLTRYSTYTTYDNNDTNVGDAMGGTGWSSAQYIGVTLEASTGTIRFWQNVTAAAPTSVTSWDGVGAGAGYTNVWPTGANYLAFGCWTGSPGSNGIDDLTAGDFAAGGGSTLIKKFAAYRRMRLG